ncbi:MAG TPA: hypothetical protein VIJ40_01705 [Acidimicrobiales bacterium]
MNVLRQYWEKLNNKPVRLAGACVLLIALVLSLSNPPGTPWNHVASVLQIVGVFGLGFLVFHKRH